MKMDTGKIAIIAITSGGIEIAKRLSGEFPADIYVNTRYSDHGQFKVFNHLKEVIPSIFREYRGAVFIMSLGAVVRIIAPYLDDKFHDIPVIVIDDLGKFVIPVISGHHGANALSLKISRILGGEAVLTTASDINGINSVDSVATRYGLTILNRENLAVVSGDMLAGLPVQVINKTPMIIPELEGSDRGRKIIITYMEETDSSALVLVPRLLDIGIGFSTDATLSDMSSAIDILFRKYHLYKEAIRSISTIDLKSSNRDIHKLAEDLNCPLYFYRAGELNLHASEKSDIVFRATGAYSVSNAAARISSKNGMPVITKEIINNVTVSVFLNGH